MFDRTTNNSVSSSTLPSVSTFYDVEELQDFINQQQLHNSMKAGSSERRPICAQMSLDSVLSSRSLARNYSVNATPHNNNMFTQPPGSATTGPNISIPGSFHTGTSTQSSSPSSASCTQSLISINDSAFTMPVREHRKLDRSASEPGDRLSSLLANNGGLIGRGLNSTRYKTELCRPFEESGYCRYGDKCQFAHGEHELRNLSRHPKYKTEPCRTYHTVGFCPYGARCHFIHNEEERALCMQQQQLQQQQQQRHMSGGEGQIASGNMNVIHPGPVRRPQSINFSSSLSSLVSSADSPPSSVTDSPSLSPTFFGEEFPFVQSSSYYNSGLPTSTQPPHATTQPPTSLGTYSQSNVTNVTNINAVFNLATANNNNSVAVNKSSAGVIDTSPSMEPFSSDVLTSLMSPLNVQTQLSNLNPSLLNKLLNEYNNNHALQHQTCFENAPVIHPDSQQSNHFLDLSDLHYELLVGAPPSPPDSVSGDSLASSMSGSSGSLENSHAPCASPTDRLSVFRKLQEECC